MKNSEIIRRYEQLRSQRRTLDQTWDLIERFISPIRGGKFFQEQTSEHEVQSRRAEIFDSTSITSADNLAASIHGNLTSPYTQWFGLTLPDPALTDQVEVREWLEDTARRTYEVLQDSNFNTEIGEVYLDLVCFGNSVVTEEWVDGELVFQCIPVREAYFEPDYLGKVSLLFRRLQWTAHQIITRFGRENMPEYVLTRERNTDERIEVIFCIYPRPDKQTVRGNVAPLNRPYGFKYVLLESGDMLGEEGGYYDMPAFGAKWRKASGSRWGYGPGNLALPTAMSLNRLTRMVLESAEKVVDPATLTTQRGLLSDLNLSPKGLTVVRDLENSIRPYESGARFDVSALQVDDMRNQIMRIFLADQIDLKESPAMTATEAQIRYQRMARMLGSTIGRLQSELFDPIIERTVQLLARENQLAPPPEALRGLTEQPYLAVEYTGPVPRAQRQDLAASMSSFLMLTAEAAQAFPQLRDVIDPDRYAYLLAEASGVPATVLRKTRELEELREQQQAQQQQMENTARAQQQGEAMEAMGKGEQALRTVEG